MSKTRHYMFDGTKGVPIDPDVPGFGWAWKWTAGEPEDTGDMTALKAYSAVAAVRRAVDMRCNALADIPRHWYDQKGNELEDCPFEEGLSNLLWRIEASLQIYGAAYALRLQNGFGRSVGLRWLATPTISFKADPVTGDLQFTRTIGNVKTEFGVDRVAYVWLPSPFVELDAAPAPIETVIHGAGVQLNIGRFASAYFARGAISPTILTVEGNPSDDERQRFKAWWQQIVGGIRNAFTSEVLNAKVTVQTLSPEPKNLAMQELNDEQRRAIALGMGIPHTMLYSEAANYATAAQDALTFYQQTIGPRAELIEEALNKQVFEPLGFELELAVEETSAYQSDEGKRGKALSELVAGGVPLDIAMLQAGYDMTVEASVRIRMSALIKEMGSYETARAVFEVTADPDSLTPETLALLDAMRPASVPIAASPAAAQLPSPSQDAGLPPDPMAGGSMMSQDMERWQRKALKLVKAGKPAACEFESEHIPEHVHEAMVGSLEGAEDADAVKALFAAAREWQEYP